MLSIGCIFRSCSFSMRTAILAIVSTAKMGYLPTAVSLESITASVPSMIAFATSEISARVALGLLTMLSSICVAVITGIPRRFAVLISCFWAIGTSSAGISTPRSPRATITPSHTERIASILAIASCFSILAITLALRPEAAIKSLTSRTSSGVQTKLSATQSTPSDSPNRKSSRSFSVTALTNKWTFGKFTPLLLESVPPITTRQ